MVNMNQFISFDKLNIGDKLKFQEDIKTYTIKAIGYPYVICTTPFNLQKTVYYTILDFKKRIRNRHNLIFNPYDFKDQKDIDECLKDLLEKNHSIEISHRGQLDLNIIDIQSNEPKIK